MMPRQVELIAQLSSPFIIQKMKPIQTLDDVAAGLNALKVLDTRLIPVIESAGPVPLRLR